MWCAISVRLLARRLLAFPIEMGEISGVWEVVVRFPCLREPDNPEVGGRKLAMADGIQELRDHEDRWRWMPGQGGHGALPLKGKLFVSG